MYGYLAQSAAPQTKVQRAIDLLPPCWSEEVSRCVRGVDNTYPNCTELNALYNENDPATFAVVKAYINELPYCPAPAEKKTDNTVLYVVGAIAATALVAVLVR